MPDLVQPECLLEATTCPYRAVRGVALLCLTLFSDHQGESGNLSQSRWADPQCLYRSPKLEINGVSPSIVTFRPLFLKNPCTDNSDSRPRNCIHTSLAKDLT